MTTDDGLTVGSTSVFWDNAGTTAIAGTAEWNGVTLFNMMTVALNFSPAITGPAGAFIQNGLQVVNSFDGLQAPPNNPPNLPAGSYQIGTIIWQTTGGAGTTNITAGLNAFDAFGVGGSNITTTVSFGGASINVVPEPATASLLGLGLIGLIMAGRRKRS